jgi:hypothetical protein
MPSSPAGEIARPPVALASKQTIPAPAPEALKIATSWQAHDGHIISLVPTTSPPALVSTDGDKHVRVWSTAGDLWGHFQLAGVDPGNTFIWPPPHVIAAQHALMNVAKGLCKRMGLASGGSHDDDSKKKRRSFARKSMKVAKEKDGTTSAASDKKSAKKVIVKSANEPEVSKKERKYPRKKGPNIVASEGDSNAFLTEPRTSPTATPTASESETGGGTTADETNEAPAPPKPISDRPSAAAKALAAIKQEPPKEREMIDENLFDDDDDVPFDGGDEKTEEEIGKRLVADKEVRRAHFNSMIRDHGFSRGFKSYRHLQSRLENSEKRGQKLSIPDSPANNRRKGDSIAELSEQRTNFFGRDAADFGVLLETSKDTDHWSQSTKNMGPRSCSEGALLRYAQAAVHSMTRTVYDEMRVDVTKIDLKELRKPSFIAALDVRPEVTPEFRRDASSATAQAVQKILAPKASSEIGGGGLNRSASAPRRMTALQGAGSSMVSKSK